MIIKKEGLIGKMNDISIGDVILMTSKNSNLAGYVAQLKANSVNLSVEDPFKNNYDKKAINQPFNPTNWYELKDFESVEVLKKYYSIEFK